MRLRTTLLMLLMPVILMTLLLLLLLPMLLHLLRRLQLLPLLPTMLETDTSGAGWSTDSSVRCGDERKSTWCV